MSLAGDIRPRSRMRERKALATREDVERLVPSASRLMAQAAIAEAERMIEEMRRKAALSLEIGALAARLAGPDAADDLALLALVGAVIRRAASNDLRKVALCRFAFTTVPGGARRAMGRPDWHAAPAAVRRFQRLWSTHLAPLGYALCASPVEDGPGTPCAFELVLSWR